LVLMRSPGPGSGPPVAPGAGPLGEAARFGTRAWGSEVLQFLNYRLDLFVLSAFASTATVGRYSVAVSLTALGWILPHGLQPVLFSRTSSLDANVQRGYVSAGDSDREVTRACRHLVVLLLPTAAMLALLLVFAVPLVYGPGFDATTGLGFILLPGVLAVGLAKVLSVVITGRGRPIYTLYVSGATAAVTVALYAALIPALGASGAALGSTLSYLASCGLYVALLRRTTGIDPRSALIPRRSDLADYRRALGSLRARVRALRHRDTGRKPVRVTSQ
jgi:O-antigen/teichoic acid export membrane protein